jgi:hypothetical protein
MKPDLYTKTVLSVIAIMLSVIAGNQYIHPTTTVQAQGGQFAGVQYSTFPGGGHSFFDPRTGDIWVYQIANNVLKLFGHGKVTRFGENGTWQGSSR